MFGCECYLKYKQCMNSIINVINENKDKDILAMSLISNIQSKCIFNKTTEDSYGEEIHRQDLRAVKEIQEFLSFV